MKKVSTVAAKQSSDFSNQRLTIGLDLGDRSSHYCVLEEAGRILLESKVSSSPNAMRTVFGGDGAHLDESGRVVKEQKVATTAKVCKRHSEPWRAVGWRWKPGRIRRG